MRSTTARRFAVGATALLITLTACGGGDEEAADDEIETSDEATAEESQETTTTTVRVACDVELLTAAANASYAGTTVSRESCSSGKAIALLSGDAANGESVAFFVTEAGEWKIVAIGAVDGATADALPEGFSRIQFTRWLSSKLRADNPEAYVAPSETGSDEPTPEDGLQIYEPTTTTTAPPTTTTTAPPPPPTEPQLDPYCIEFPEEPSCLENPYLPAP